MNKIDKAIGYIKVVASPYEHYYATLHEHCLHDVYKCASILEEEINRLNEALLKIKSMDDTQAGLTQYSLFNQARIIVEEALAYHEDKI